MLIRPPSEPKLSADISSNDNATPKTRKTAQTDKFMPFKNEGTTSENKKALTVANEGPEYAKRGTTVEIEGISPSANMKFLCHLCPKGFNSKPGLVFHMHREIDYRCVECIKCITTMRNKI